MRKAFPIGITIFIAIVVIFIFFSLFNRNPISRNKEEVITSINSMYNTNNTTMLLSDITRFDWHKVYIFSPNTSTKEQENVLGRHKGVKYRVSPNEGGCIAFIRDNDVVCYISGNSDEIGFKLSYEYSKYNENFVKVSPSDVFYLSRANGIVDIKLDY